MVTCDISVNSPFFITINLTQMKFERSGLRIIKGISYLVIWLGFHRWRTNHIRLGQVQTSLDQLHGAALLAEPGQRGYHGAEGLENIFTNENKTIMQFLTLDVMNSK